MAGADPRENRAEHDSELEVCHEVCSDRSHGAYSYALGTQLGTEMQVRFISGGDGNTIFSNHTVEYGHI